MLQDTENPWKIFAEHLGAKYQLSEEGTSLVAGKYRDYPFILKMIFIQAAPKVNLFLTHFEIELENKSNLKLKVYREGILQKLTKLFGTRDILLNDRSFDKKYIVEGSNEEKVKEIMSPDLRAKIIEQGEAMIILDQDILIYEQSGKIIDINKLFNILDILVTIGDKLKS